MNGGSMPGDKPIELALLEDEAFERSLLAFGLEHIGGYSLVLRCGCDVAAQEAAARLEPVSYTHLTLPTNREV